MLSKAELWEAIESLVKAEGLELFDLDMPDRHSGTVRIFVAREPGTEAGVGIEECAAVSKRISSDEKLGELLLSCALEVSSPGINRRLQRPEHFKGAVGERLKLTLRTGGERSEMVVGKLLSFADAELEIEVEASGEKVRVPLEKIAKARVDFLFDGR